ncbi:vWA domain-containing protein [Candidatus Ruminimicrobiellum ovillum]|uniref:vWA domain-containing protein n=1 Tax=Candidatus Ruminimicrobiellum ovillum TaxID=1947927 RepID=UPI00355A0161
MFENVNNLLLLTVVLAITIIFLFSFKLSRKTINEFTNSSLWNKMLTVDFFKVFLKNIFFILALIFIVIALARPKWGLKQVEAKSLSSDIVVAIDVSKSMLAQDLKPDRLTRAKIIFKDLTERLKGQRIGLIAFAGQAYWQCPLTSDVKAFEMFLSLLDTDTVPFYGTNISAPIDLACESLKKVPSNAKALVIITDGESFDGDLKSSLEEAKESQTKIFCVGIGTEKGEPIPTYENGQFKEYLKDDKGKTVVTKLDSSTLEQIALATGGRYYNMNQDQSLNNLVSVLNKLDKIEGTANIFNNLEDRYYYFLAVSLIFLLLYLFIPATKRQKVGRTEDWEKK